LDFNFPISQDSRRINKKGIILAAHQPECLPWLGFIQKATMGDIYIILDTIQFVKEHWHNKNQILTHNGPQSIIVPVKNKSRLQTFTDVQIDNTKHWRKKHLNTIKYSYSKSPYFNQIYPEIEKIYNQDYFYLIEFNEKFIRYAFDKFKISIPIIKASNLKNQGHSLEGKKSELIINLCKAVKADVFVFGKDGKTYVEPNKFKNNNLKYIFQNFTHPVYNQFHKGEFISSMSFLDILFNHGSESYKLLNLNQYDE
jgi:hypothetical protein